MSDWVNHSHLKDVNNASFGFQWCFFFAITPTRKWKTTRHIMHAANCRVFFHGSESNERTKFSELGPRRYVNDVSFRFHWVFFQLGLRGNGTLQATLCRLWFLVVFSHGSIDQINRRRMKQAKLNKRNEEVTSRISSLYVAIFKSVIEVLPWSQITRVSCSWRKVHLRFIYQFCTSHPVLCLITTYVITGMNVRAVWEHGIVFQSTDQIKRYDGL